MPSKRVGQSVGRKKAGRPRARASERASAPCRTYGPAFERPSWAGGLSLRLRRKAQGGSGALGGSAMAPLLGGPLRRFPPGPISVWPGNRRGRLRGATWPSGQQVGLQHRCWELIKATTATRVTHNRCWQKRQTTRQPHPHPPGLSLDFSRPGWCPALVPGMLPCPCRGVDALAIPKPSSGQTQCPGPGPFPLGRTRGAPPASLGLDAALSVCRGPLPAKTLLGHPRAESSDRSLSAASVAWAGVGHWVRQ